jgi:hypothetical protein
LARGERGLTLLEVVVALLLFSVMGVLLLSGQSTAADSLLRARTERDISYLLPLRLNLAALSPDEYEDGEEGGFPSDKESRFFEEDEVFGAEYEGYRWRIEKAEAIGSGSEGPAKIPGGDALEVLFAEEGAAPGEGEEAPEVEAESLDRMWYLRVTVYPPGYSESLTDEEKRQIPQPRSAWTAIAITADVTETGK